MYLYANTFRLHRLLS